MHLFLAPEALNLNMDCDEDWPTKSVVTYITLKALVLMKFLYVTAWNSNNEDYYYSNLKII